MNVCLIRPSRCRDKEESVVINNTPALGLAFIAGALKQAGHTVSVIDAIGESPMAYHPIGDIHLDIKVQLPLNRLYVNGLSAIEIANKIPDGVQIIGISAMFSNNWLFDRYLIDFLGERFPQALIVAGGESITAMAELGLKQTKHLDVCVLGEGEETIVDLLAAIEKHGDFKDIDGIAYRDSESGKAVVTKRRTRVKNMDDMPLPAWEYFPMENYHKYEVRWGNTNQKSIPLLATRGCPYSCTFCSSPQMWGTRYYMRNPIHIINEMEYMMQTYGITSFDFYDLTAILKKEWIMTFTREIINRKLNVIWELPVGTRSEVIDSEVARNLYLSGCRQVTYAPETGSPSLLKLIRKKVKVPNMLKSMRSSHKEKIYINLNMIIGLPGETHADVWRTIWFLIQCSWAGVNDITQSRFHPYPGSVLFDKLVVEKRIDLSNDDFFLELVFLHSDGKGKYYTDLISEPWYKLYELLTNLTFLSSNYLFRPIRFGRMVRSILSNRYENRVERKLVEYFKQKKPQRTEVINPEAGI